MQGISNSYSNILVRISLLLFLVVLNFSCKNNSNHTEDLIETDSEEVSIPENTTKIFPWSDIVEEAEVIRLELTTESLVAKIEKTLLTQNKIYIYDSKIRDLLIFDINGKFISRFNKQGQGPGEINEMRSFDVDKDGNIYILDYNKISKFNVNGDHELDIPFSYTDTDDTYINAVEIALAPNDKFYLWTGSFGVTENNDHKQFSLFVLDNRGKIINKYFPSRMKTFKSRYFTPYGNTYITRPPDYDSYTIHLIEDNTIKEKYHINFGENSLPEGILKQSFEDNTEFNRILRETNYILGINNVIENDDYLYFNFFQTDRIRAALYSKKTKKALVGKVAVSGFAPSYLCFSDKNYLYGFIEASDYLSVINGSSQYIFNRIDSLSIDDNPLLVKIKLKEF